MGFIRPSTVENRQGIYLRNVSSTVRENEIVLYSTKESNSSKDLKINEFDRKTIENNQNMDILFYKMYPPIDHSKSKTSNAIIFK